MADTIEWIATIEVQDITFGTEMTGDGPWHDLTVYIHEKKASHGSGDE